MNINMDEYQYEYRYIHIIMNMQYEYRILYKLAAPRIVFFFASICHAITDPPVTKVRLWASFGVYIEHH